MINNWAIVGLGFISPRHIKAITEVGDRLVLTCDLDPAKGADYTDWKEMMEDERWKHVTHVAICTPNYLHYEMAKTFAMDGRTVLCEKPLVLASNQQLPNNVYTVLQLRFHPEIMRLKEGLKGLHNGDMIVKVKRDPNYWTGWKGKDNKSGGILFNLGIHYFDILIHLFGNNYKILRSEYSEKRAFGVIDFNGSRFNYDLEIRGDDKDQNRALVIDGEEVVLSKQDNLSFENLHVEVYKALKEGNGTEAKEAMKSIRLVEKLKYGA